MTMTITVVMAVAMVAIMRGGDKIYHQEEPTRVTPTVPARGVILVGTAGGSISIIGAMLIRVGGGLIRVPITILIPMGTHIPITILIRMAIHTPIRILELLRNSGNT